MVQVAPELVDLMNGWIGFFGFWNIADVGYNLFMNPQKYTVSVCYHKQIMNN